jgi:hypothetical protein
MHMFYKYIYCKTAPAKENPNWRFLFIAIYVCVISWSDYNCRVSKYVFGT